MIEFFLMKHNLWLRLQCRNNSCLERERMTIALKYIFRDDSLDDVVDNKSYKVTIHLPENTYSIYRVKFTELWLWHLELDLPVTNSAYRVIYDGYTTKN